MRASTFDSPSRPAVFTSELRPSVGLRIKVVVVMARLTGLTRNTQAGLEIATSPTPLAPPGHDPGVLGHHAKADLGDTACALSRTTGRT